MIADLTVRRFQECDEQDQVLNDATILWAVLNLVDDIVAGSEEALVTRSARSALVTRIGECDLTVTDLFENTVAAVEAGDLAKFGLSPPYLH